MSITPYVVGQWVREERFYGRGALLDEVLEGNRNGLWLLGTRRIGKTSVLKQLEHLASTAERQRYFPLFWDFQGCETEDDLHESFADALFDSVDGLERLGIGLAEVEDEDLFHSINRLRRELKERDLTLLVLGDEVEELVAVHDQAPRFLRRLRRALVSPENVRTVLASTVRLWQLASEETSTSPFLHGFTPALPVRGLSDGDARALVLQSHLPPDARPDLDPETVGKILRQCDNHPYLLQLLGERTVELGSVERAIEEVARDQMVGFFFASDVAMLSSEEGRILRLVSRSESVSAEEIGRRLALGSTMLEGGLHRLALLGIVRRSESGRFALPNAFFRRWLEELPEEEPAGSELRRLREEEPTLLTPPPEGAVSASGTARIDDRYDLEARIGRGTSGEVYRAFDNLLRAEVALKLLHREVCVDKDAVERLRREVVLARDISHPNLLKIYHLGDTGSRMYITMQLVEGADLAEVLARDGALPARQALSIAGKLAAALMALHRREVLHRDIKPSNILLDADGEPWVTDFGLARLQWGPAVTRNGFFLGTPAYASPEQARGERLDERSDLYALGVVLFEMVTGHAPFRAASPHDLLAQHLYAAPPDPRSLDPCLPPAVAELLLRALAKDPRDRFQTGGELSSALQGLLGEEYAR